MLPKQSRNIIRHYGSNTEENPGGLNSCAVPLFRIPHHPCFGILFVYLFVCFWIFDSLKGYKLLIIPSYRINFQHVRTCFLFFPCPRRTPLVNNIFPPHQICTVLHSFLCFLHTFHWLLSAQEGPASRFVLILCLSTCLGCSSPLLLCLRFWRPHETPLFQLTMPSLNNQNSKHFDLYWQRKVYLQPSPMPNF